MPQWGFANSLTICRLIAVPIYLFLFVTAHYRTALTVFMVAAFTDLVDGSIARWFKETSSWGALVDPIADKLLMNSVFIGLAFAQVVPVWFAALILLRDGIIMGGLFYLHRRHISVAYQPLWVSKLSTLLQMMTAAFGLVHILSRHEPFLGYQEEMLQTAILSTSVLVLLSGAAYMQQGWRILRHRG